MIKGMMRTLGCFSRDSTMSRAILRQLPVDLRGVAYAEHYGDRGERGNGRPHENGEAVNPLRAFFERRKQTGGRGIWKWRHYFDIYHRHFARFIGREVHVMEIGVYSGGSLEMWREYFGPRCRVYGVDIQEECRAYDNEWTRIFIGDQADRAFWAKVREQAPRVDILIDDGGHTPEQQIVTLEEMLPHLRPGGVFLCEDVTTDRGVGGVSDFQAFVHRLQENLQTLNFAPDCRPDGGYLSCTPSPLQRWINSIHVYPYITVIEKNEHALDELVCPKHGTEWQPFLDPGAKRADQ